MKTIPIIVLCIIGGVALVQASSPLTAYALPIAYAKMETGAPIGPDGRVVDTPEVSLAKAEHAAAHLNEKLKNSSPAIIAAYVSPAIVSPLSVITKAQSGAPIGLDGRVVDTAEVALAKAEHAAAHINAKYNANYLYLPSPSIHNYH